MSCKCEVVKDKLNNLVEFLHTAKRYDEELKLDAELILNELNRVLTLVKD